MKHNYVVTLKRLIFQSGASRKEVYNSYLTYAEKFRKELQEIIDKENLHEECSRIGNALGLPAIFLYCTDKFKERVEKLSNVDYVVKD